MEEKNNADLEFNKIYNGDCLAVTYKQIKETSKKMNELIEHAKAELRIIRLENDPIGNKTIELLEILSQQEHTPGTAMKTLFLFDKLAKWQALTPLTSNKNEWEEITTVSMERQLWQSKRNPRFFSRDNGKHWYKEEKGEKK